ncbi:arginine-tRNA-protein transferase [Massariosphaeria phaeospora]|uniref:arginyltransferase n=1 Tax=Massariosphaeria phaeospora TaxID=100035 RepID=A0A7C8MFZ2_9PLEO|nr:arginine-tRNA-protein transferase [Massariosphaeria phaeospora]
MQSLVTPCGYSSESCGYCKDASSGRRNPNSHSGSSYYIKSKSLTVEVYQGLVDRGWRRSGTILYKPDVLRHCCPHYTIRLPADCFTPGKEHRQAINRWNKFVLGEQYIREAAKLYPKSKKDKARLKNTFDLVAAIHESEHEHVKRPPEPAHRFEVTLEPDDFTQEKFELFRDYQQNVHHDEPSQVSPNGFRRFLCDSPLQRRILDADGQPQNLGSYHQCYRLDGRLIAMGILDLLPHCVSGVYFLYHSDFEKWSFGKLSALRETVLALEGGYKYYYMGYYIHSCVKMRYKGDFRPQYVLDPESYEWNPLDGEVRHLLDMKPYVSLSRERRLKYKDRKFLFVEDGNSVADTASKEDDYAEYPLPTAAESGKAVEDGMSLFDLKMPGVMTAEELQQQVALDQQKIQIRGPPRPLEASRLIAWDDGDIRDPQSIKGIIAELVACIGPDVARRVVIDFGA